MTHRFDVDRLSEASLLFSGDRFRLARQLAGLRKSDVSRMTGKSPTAVAGWESGDKRPSPATVGQLAFALAVEPGFFAVQAHDLAAVGSTPHFRSLRSTSQLARDQATAYGQVTVTVGAAVERHVELPPVDVPSYPVDVDDRNGDGPEHAAQLVRERWALPPGPVRHVVRRLEHSGVLVVFSPPAAASVDAYSFENRLRPVVVLNPLKYDYYRQRFDATHELGHLVMHSDAEPGGRIVESHAHRFAAELLLPANQVHELLPTSTSGNGWRTLQQLKEHWGVSLQALLYRARQLGRLSDMSYRNAMTRLSVNGWRRAEPGLVTALEQPSLLPAAVELLAGHGVSEAALINECRVPTPLFEAVVSRAPLTFSRTGATPETTGTRVVSLLPRPSTSESL